MPDRTLPLITRYRPKSFDDEWLMGNREVISQLQKAFFPKTRPHAYLFTGPSGVGKTTLARILANEAEADIVEIDAASHSSVDAMREIVELGAYYPISGSGVRFFIIDECHALSKSAWQALLKILEEPPEHLYICLCTTESAKVPETVQTRCYPVKLNVLDREERQRYMEKVCEAEGWEIPNDVFAAVANSSNGQPRRILTMLEAVQGLSSIEEVHRVLHLVEFDEKNGVIDFIRRLLRGEAIEWTIKGGRGIRDVLADFEERDFDSATEIMTEYLCKAMLNEKEPYARKAWMLLEALVFPTDTLNRKAKFFSSIGKILWGGEPGG